MTPRARALCEWLRDYAETRLDSALMDARRCMPPHVVLELGNRGVLGMCAAAEHGGGAFALPEVLAVSEQLGAIDLTLAIFVGIHNALGIRPIQRFGAAALQAELLPALSAGRALGAFAMTERGAGSNARNIATLAIADGDGWRLRGGKLWVGNGSWAGVINVVARRPPDEGGGMCAFAVRAGTPGLRMGPEAMTTGMRAIVQNELELDGLRAARGELLGAPGDGFAVAEDSFGLARVGISAIALGALRRCVQLAHRYARRRTINTGTLLANSRTHDVLAALVASASAAERLLEATGARADATGAPPPHLAAICKIVVPELLGHAADRATQLLGGRGYIEANELPRLVRDARLLRIFEGPTETLEMHLGSAVQAGTPAARAVLEPFAAPRALARVEAWTSELAAQLAGSGDARVAAGQRIKLAIGHVVAWGTLAAAAEASPGPLHELATHWALAQLEARAVAALAAIRSPAPADGELLRDAIAGYRERIGDVEQTLPGEDHALDPLLRRDEP